MNPVLGVAIIVLHAVILIPAAVFCVHYTIAADWWKSPAGINLFGVSASLAVVFGLNLLHFLFGPFPGLTIVALVIFAAIAAFMWQRYVLFVKAQGCSWRNARRLFAGRLGQIRDFALRRG